MPRSTTQGDPERDDFAPFLLGNRFRIAPPGIAPADDDRLHLVLSRGAFGSGEHETTASCFEVLERLPEVAGANLLDLGSGTGVLSLAALALGARTATCVDIEPGAVATARRNGVLNGMEDRMIHIVGTLADVSERNFDLILANLYGDLLLQLAEELAARARSGALLLLSGMLWEYNFEVRRTFERFGCSEIENHMLPEFSTALLRMG